jgi:hypothetical protein
MSVCTGIQCEPLILLAVQNVPKGVGQRGRGKVPIFIYLFCGCVGECLIGRHKERVAFEYWNNAVVTVLMMRKRFLSTRWRNGGSRIGCQAREFRSLTLVTTFVPPTIENFPEIAF